MPRGGWRGGGRPRKETDKLRKQLGCRVRPDVYAWIQAERERKHISTGEVIDDMADTLRAQQEPT